MGDIIIIAVIACILGLAIHKIYKNKKNSSCGCSCSGCNLKDKCKK